MGEDRVAAARQLLIDCGQDPDQLDDAELVVRAEQVTAAVRRFEAAGGGIAAVLDEHLAAEFQQHDADQTMVTMAPDPYLNHVPVMTGGAGREQVHRFYRDHWIPAWPPEVEVTPVSRTVGEQRVVDELVVSFTHDRPMDFMLPGIEPTGRPVSLPHTVVVGFEQEKVAYEHIYWDQASLLVQVGLLDPQGLPVTGAEQAEALLTRRPNNELMSRAGIEP
jgi:carboxymethylenebutenolidase